MGPIDARPAMFNLESLAEEEFRVEYAFGSRASFIEAKKPTQEAFPTRSKKRSSFNT